jgi:hypothetical protein
MKKYGCSKKVSLHTKKQIVGGAIKNDNQVDKLRSMLSNISLREKPQKKNGYITF